ncbi:hypothetical protein [Brevibacterium oceani]|uniref:hypothetical protein n=1 Tax=Brevibacterium oceani TaxID=358099 RepID=UPI0015E6C3F1|nr:hypothetical protein [Brevibacterium oceani]
MNRWELAWFRMCRRHGADSRDTSTPRPRTPMSEIAFWAVKAPLRVLCAVSSRRTTKT